MGDMSIHPADAASLDVFWEEVAVAHSTQSFLLGLFPRPDFDFSQTSKVNWMLLVFFGSNFTSQAVKLSESSCPRVEGLLHIVAWEQIVDSVFAMTSLISLIFLTSILKKFSFGIVTQQSAVGSAQDLNSMQLLLPHLMRGSIEF